MVKVSLSFSFFKCIILLILYLPAYLQGQTYTPAKPFGEQKLVNDFVCSEVVYPEKDLEQGIEGEVVLVFIVGQDGTVSDIRVKEGVSPEIDREAIRIFRFLQWDPAIRLGNPVTSQQEYSFDFNIKKYNRHCKQRGYEKTEYPYSPFDTSMVIYDQASLDRAPQPIFEEQGMNLGRFITQNLVYPEAAFKQNIAGKVVLSFVVETQGRVSNILIEKPLGGGCTEEALRILHLLKWMPGTRDGCAVRSRINIAITFELPDDSDTKVYDNNPTGQM